MFFKKNKMNEQFPTLYPNQMTKKYREVHFLLLDPSGYFAPIYLHSDSNEMSLKLGSGEWIFLMKKSQRKGGEDGSGAVDLVTCILGVESTWFQI